MGTLLAVPQATLVGADHLATTALTAKVCGPALSQGFDVPGNLGFGFVLVVEELPAVRGDLDAPHGLRGDAVRGGFDVLDLVLAPEHGVGVDVVPERIVDGLPVNPFGDWACAGREGDSPQVLTADVAVSVVGTLTDAVAGVNEVLDPALRDDEVQIVGVPNTTDAPEHGYALGERTDVAGFKVGADAFISDDCVRGHGLLTTTRQPRSPVPAGGRSHSSATVTPRGTGLPLPYSM